ncbi:hypothetical protein AMK01_CH03860 [Rhizobium sp. N6212]|nr:hypothetical protein AMK01_CH03860 [Rhizobium sp. N6212]ANK99311.1 hypothetical protein AMK00_CH03863 [Rhizobium sp. N621]ANL05442.1 hypothetical protein AMJ99_CH03942 [Rhizobium esperanzae]ANL11496.1 hypothetical protein AMJ98_CH03890 [Rhizobium sp. N1341]ANM36282.1 hypothetical protein AMK04_CH03947 [Rhizobium sp. N871]ANM42341.1 hypothetical protein AMK03_CH03894 [Rhizobium sp. N741]
MIIGGVALLAGVSGGAAVYVGKDRLMGVAGGGYGLECSDVNLVTIRKQDHVWVRKYIKTEPTDGITRVKTALRVAQAVYAAQKPDLVQVVVLDENGPTLRSDIRGRAIGADVVYIPHPDKAVPGLDDKPYTARYYDGKASENGLFFGERIELPLDEIAMISSGFKDPEDCVDPVAVGSTKNGEKAKETKAAGGAHGAAPAAESEAAPAHEPAPAREGASADVVAEAPAEEPPAEGAETR